MGILAVAAIVSLWVIPTTILVNRIVPDPYMDEIFHIPQAQQYCKGNFGSWDPMITTPPGLYYISLLHISSLFPGLYITKASSSFSDVCSTMILRSINSILAVACSITLYKIITHLKPNLSDQKATVHAVVLALYPLHWFFTFLYYTDVASVTVVLLMYLATLKQKCWLSALMTGLFCAPFKFMNFTAGLFSYFIRLVGAFAVVVRQTNIVWVLFVACTGITNTTLICYKKGRKTVNLDASVPKIGSVNTYDSNKMDLNLRKRKSNTVVGITEGFLNTHPHGTSASSGLFDEIWEICVTSWHLKWKLLYSFSPFLVVVVAFFVFVIWNGSIVLGAKEAHTASPHFAQLFYYSLVSALATAPMHFTFSGAWEVLQSIWKNWLLGFFQGFMVIVAGFISIHYFSIAHPYLLADNRHYTFYLWRKIIGAHWSIKYLLVPLYIYSWISITRILSKVQKKIWVLAYFLATAAVLVPAPLIEFRYYTIPFFLFMLHSPIEDNRSWLLIGLMYVAVNVFTMAMFLFRPFQWSHEPGIQRFIW